MRNLFGDQNNTNYLSLIEKCGLDPYKAGDVVGYGGQHIVYDYGKDKVLKVPRFTFTHRLFGIHCGMQVFEEGQLLQAFFPNYTLETQVHFSEQPDIYCIVQEKIQGFTFPSPQNIAKVAKELMTMHSINERLFQEHRVSLDWFGKQGFALSALDTVRSSKISLTLCNIVIDSFSHLKIMDTNLYDLREKHSPMYQRKWRQLVARPSNRILHTWLAGQSMLKES